MEGATEGAASGEVAAVVESLQAWQAASMGAVAMEVVAMEGVAKVGAATEGVATEGAATEGAATGAATGEARVEETTAAAAMEVVATMVAVETTGGSKIQETSVVTLAKESVCLCLNL